MFQYIYFALSLALPELQKYLLRQEEKHKKKQNITFLLNNLMLEIIALKDCFLLLLLNPLFRVQGNTKLLSSRT